MVHGVKDWRGNEYGVGDTIVYASGAGGRSIQVTEATVLDIYRVAYSRETYSDERVALDYEGESRLRVKVQPLRDSRAYGEDGGRMKTDREYFSKSTGKKLTWAQAHGTYVSGRYVNPDGTDWERPYRFGRVAIPDDVTYVDAHWERAWPKDDLEERVTTKPVPPVTLTITKNITLLERKVG